MEEKMDVLKAIDTRHSYWGKYLDTPVPKGHLIQIIQAGLVFFWMT